MNAYKTKQICFLGLLGAVAISLSYLEGFIIVPGLPPGVKLGLSNIATMYCVFFLGYKSAYFLTGIKALSVFLTRGVTGGFLSLLGGMAAVTVMLILMRPRFRLSYITVSVFGALAHNFGQLAGACLMTKTAMTFYYLPVLTVSGVAAGVVTGIILKTVLPALGKIDPSYYKNEFH